MRSLRASLLVFSLVALCACGCSSLPERSVAPDHRALLPDSSGRLDELVGPEETRRAGSSGFRLVGHGPEALAIRIHSSALADRSIDVQTYIWHADLTGLYLANELLLAADRGVRVRLLLDDLDARNNNYGLAALAAHPKIHVRLFNPQLLSSDSNCNREVVFVESCEFRDWEVGHDNFASQPFTPSYFPVVRRVCERAG